MSILFIDPPVWKPCEPPMGIARLMGHLKSQGIPCHVWSANAEGLHHLLGLSPETPDDRTRKCLKWRERHLHELQHDLGYRNADRYRRAVEDLSHLLSLAGGAYEAQIGFSSYEHSRHQPLKSAHLKEAACHPEKNPYFPHFTTRLPKVLEECEATWVGISLSFLSQALTTFALLGFLRANFPKVRLALGGGLVTSWMRRPSWKNPFEYLMDLLVCGPGEEILTNLFHSREEISVVQYPPESPPDYGDQPWDLYLSSGPILPYNTSYGCYWNRCAFCPERAEGRHFKPYSEQRIIHELQEICAKVSPALIHFTDNAIPPTVLRALALNPPGPPWYGFARCDSDLLDPDFTRLLKASGCLMLQLGIESGDDRVLEHMNKGFNSDLSSQILQSLRRAGIATYVYLLFGTPWEDEEAALRTLSFVEKNSGAITFINPALFHMPREETIHEPEFMENDLSLYLEFEHEKGWDRRKVRHFMDRIFKRNPAVSRILGRTPSRFTSNHAPLLLLHGGIQGYKDIFP